MGGESLEMNPERFYSPGQAVHYSPGAVKWMLSYYFSHLHQGRWPEKGGGGCETRSGQPHAPHETASAIAGELRWRLSQQGRAGDAIFRIYTGMETMRSMAHVMGWSEHVLDLHMRRAFKAIYHTANPHIFNARCPCCGEFLKEGHICPMEITPLSIRQNSKKI